MTTVDPWAAPESFSRDIYRMTDDAQAAGLEVITPALESSYADGFRSTGAMAAAVAGVMLDSEIRRVWLRAAQRSNREARRHWLAEAKRAGILDAVKDPDLANALREAWEKENIARFKRIRDQVKKRTEEHLRHQRETNVAAATAAAGLLALGLPTFHGRLRGRGRVIATDQLETLAGLIAQHQQTDAGIDRFVWVTRDDAKVRPKHYAWHKREFTWEDGAPGNIWPGQEINCRCAARGVVE